MSTVTKRRTRDPALVAKKKRVDVIPQYYATTAYKQWARGKREEKGWSLIELAKRIKKITPAASATSGGLSQFFGPDDVDPVPSNTTLMPELNKLFGQPPPPVCDPTSTFAQIRDAFDSEWSTMTPKQQLVVFAAFGIDPPRKG
jgi:hypothetical protein